MERYAQLKGIIKQAEAELDSIKESIAQQIPAEGLETDFGKFSWVVKKDYTYSPKVSELTQELKTLKKEEEVTADYKETKYFKFN